MRVGFDGRFIDDHFPGIGRYASELVRALADLAPEPIQLLVRPNQRTTIHDLPGLLIHPRIRTIGVPASVFALASQWQTARAAQRADVDLLHTPYYVHPYWQPPLLGNGRRAPIPRQPGAQVATIFDLTPLVVPDDVPRRGRWLFRVLVALSSRVARRVITLSASTRDDLVRLIGARPERVRVVPPGCSPRFAPAAPAAIAAVRARYALPPRYILTVGINKPHKNVGALVAAVGRVAREVTLVVAGPTDCRYPAPGAQADRSDGRVRHLGVVPDADLPALYAGAAVVVIPSLAEGFGFPALEAMACGAPVLAADRAALPEVVGDAGLLFDPADPNALATALARLLDDPALRERLSAAGQARAQTFTWARAARATWAVYEEALAAR